MNGIRRWTLSLLLLALLAAPAAVAYEYPLTSDAIREAYFLGKEYGERQNEFFAKYTKHLPMPKTGPYVARVELQTPFANVVNRIAHMPLGYSSPDAVQQFLGKAGVVRVHIEIDFTPTYPPKGWVGAPGGWVGNFWQDFQFQLTQGKRHAIKPLSVDGEPIYSRAALSGVIGANVQLTYDPASIRSAPATVVVTTPEGRRVEATFDLGMLK